MELAIKPFSATHYNTSLIGDCSSVVCPPYDVISKKDLSILRRKSAYNFSNILIADNKNYKRTKTTLDSWLRKGVLVDDKKESLYLYEQKFNVEGKPFKRFGVISLLRMDKNGVLPHENTLKAPKEDRKRIINAVQANLSPIFVIADKHLKTFNKVYKAYCRRRPFLKFLDSQGNTNCIWKIQDSSQIREISQEINKSKLVIADGHHRFEISYDYFKRNKKKFKNLNYVLAYITGRQKGLSILPTHRVMTVADREDIFLCKSKEFFDIIEVKQEVLEKQLKRAKVFCLGIYRLGKFHFLKLKKPDFLGKIDNRLYRRLDTYVFHELVLPLFSTRQDTEYTHSLDEAKKLAGKTKTAFILRPASLDSVIKISSKGLRLPQKSTYFYPKVLSGAVIRRFKKK